MHHLQPDSSPSPDWNSLSPFLDEAMASLSEHDREALLLRFFKNQDFRAVGAALGVSDDTAQKRVARGLQKLRIALAKRGVAMSSLSLSTVLAASAAPSAPPGLAAQWIAASLAGASAQTSTALTLINIMSMTKVQIGLTALVVGGLVVTTAVEHQAARNARVQNEYSSATRRSGRGKARGCPSTFAGSHNCRAPGRPGPDARTVAVAWGGGPAAGTVERRR